MKYAFHDKAPIEHNSVDGISYVAAGLVETIQSEEPLPSGKEILTVHVDPLGNVNWEWRAHSEINMYEIGEGNYEAAMHAISHLENLQKGEAA